MDNPPYLNRLVGILKNPQIELEVQALVKHLTDKISQGASIWIMGNGGSASTAEHFETDLAYIRKSDQKINLKATALTANSSLTTAISNDLGFNYIFSHQIERKAQAGDVCIVISASGNSPNLTEAIRVSKILGLSTVAILGFDGGELLKVCDYKVFTKSSLGDYGPVEDIHLAVCHYIAEELRLKIFKAS